MSARRNSFIVVIRMGKHHKIEGAFFIIFMGSDKSKNVISLS
ncbi:MAG: hypothetical protein ACI88H_001084 [Cocleimonas sp.]|jgi:hypothetical protein